VVIYEHQFAPGTYALELSEGQVYSTYIVAGKIQINGELMEQDGFAILEDGQNTGIKAQEASRLFVIETPRKIDYLTYQELMQSQI